MNLGNRNDSHIDCIESKYLYVFLLYQCANTHSYGVYTLNMCCMEKTIVRAFSKMNTFFGAQFYSVFIFGYWREKKISEWTNNLLREKVYIFGRSLRYPLTCFNALTWSVVGKNAKLSMERIKATIRDILRTAEEETIRFIGDNKIITFSHCFRNFTKFQGGVQHCMVCWLRTTEVGTIKNYWIFDELPSGEDCSWLFQFNLLPFATFSNILVKNLFIS